jgi:hypothetical protein
MRSFVRRNLVVLALAAGLACGTGAYANTFSWSISGAGITGTGTMTDTYVSGGWYLVDSMTGNLTINGTGGAITLTPYAGTPGTYGTDPSGKYYYDNLINPSSTPELDMYGLVFSVANITGGPLNLCGAYGCINNSSSPYWLLENWSGGNNYPVDFSAPEPSAMVLLSLGLVGLMLALGWKRLRAS